ncbi:hypothetical protein BJV77DRAFT_1035252 [Russula vinacea]|nr:hypothetical protein BJV77DRAFT_1035252 [Russula vinacea]
MISTASTRILATTLLVGFLPCVKADCWRNWDGSRICNGLGNLARVMFGLAGLVAFLAAAFTFSYCWKQRKRRAEQALAQQTQRGGGATYRSQYSSAGGPRLFAPQAPPPVHNSLNSPYIYDTTPGFAPPSVRSPQYQPPVTSDRKETV